MTRSITLYASLLLAAGCTEPGPHPAAPPEDAAPRVLEVGEALGSERGERPLDVAEHVEPAAETPSEDAASEPLLVWGRDADGGAYTWWLDRAADGEWDVIEAEGIYVATDGALWRWSTETVELPLGMDCELDGPNAPYGDTGRTGTGVRATLERVDGSGERRVVMEPSHDQAEDSADYDETVSLAGSVGPILFVRSAAWQYACGAHGGSMHSFLPFDASQGAPLSLYDADATVALADRIRAEGWAALEQEMPFADGPQDLSVTMHRPAFGDDGTLALDHQLTAGTCYACSDGNWDSYTTSTQVRDDALPEALAPHADYPADALPWLDHQVEGLDVRGISRPDPALRPLFEARQIPGC